MAVRWLSGFLAASPFTLPESGRSSRGHRVPGRPAANPPVTRARWRVQFHVADKGWQNPPDGQAFVVTDSQDGRRHDFACPKGTDRASIQRIPIDDRDQCQVPAAVLAWW